MSVADVKFSLIHRLVRLGAAGVMSLAPLMLGGAMPARAAGVVGNGTPGVALRWPWRTR